MTDDAFDPTTTFLHLSPDGGARRIPVTPTFWQELAAGKHPTDGRLVTASHVSEGVAHWEMHPKGDELLLVQTGAVEVILDEPEGPRAVVLTAGSAFVVPKGVWHRFKVHEPGLVVFVTAGEGTQHRPG